MKALIDCGSMGNYISDSLVLALGMDVIPEEDFELLEMANKTTVKAQGYIFFWLDSGEFSCRVIARVFPNLRSEVIFGTPWLIKENLDIDWVKPKVKLRRRGQLQVLPLWRDQDSDDEADVHSHEEKCARVNMCSAKAFKRYLRKQKQPQAYVAFLRKVGESAEEKVEGEQSHQMYTRSRGEVCLKRFGKCVKNTQTSSQQIYQRNCHQSGWVMSSKLTWSLTPS